LLNDARTVSVAPDATDTVALAPGERVRLLVRTPPARLEELRDRLRSTSWPAGDTRGDRRRGADIDYLRELVDYWAEQFDWNSREESLNGLPSYLARVGEHTVHYLHARSPHPGALPLVIAHGWPSGPAEFSGLLGPLTDPPSHGGSTADAFDVVLVSLPGFLLSGPPGSASYDIRDGAQTIADLMAMLGYSRYGVHGGDWGAVAASWLGHLAPDAVVGIHLTTVVAPIEDPADLSERDRADLERQRRFRREQMAYQAIQSTKPDALAVGLADSPAGLAAWLVDKYRSWSDCDGDVERVFHRDLLLELISLYWLTATIGTSMRMYFDTRVSGRIPLAVGPVRVPTGCAIFGRELTRPPRSAAQQWYRIERWTTFPTGGHFPALEHPTALAKELRGLFHTLRK
jgi:microsomal epoxide hydrolase